MEIVDPQSLIPASPDPAGIGLEPAGDGKMWLDGRYRAALRRAGLMRFEDVMDCTAGRCVRKLKVRENWYLPLGEPESRTRGVYLKKHHVRTWRTLLRAKLGAGPGENAGRREAINVRLLAAEGIPVMRVVAYGEKLHASGLLESFVMTEELEGFVELPQFLRTRFPPPATPRPAGRDRDLDRLVRQIAQLARRFHAAGYNHRDFYCCHFFVREPARGTFEIRLIDLQRVDRRRFRRRWIVKDLAQLAWSAPPEQITCTHKIAFLRHYLGVGKLRPADKRLVRRVLFKQYLMERKLRRRR